MADEVWAAFGTLDVLVNNVGDVSSEQMSWDELTQEALDAVIDIDVKGTLLMTHEFGARMLEQGHGSIVQVGSTVIVRGSRACAAVRGGQVRDPRHHEVLRQGVRARPCASTRSRRGSWRPSGC